MMNSATGGSIRRILVALDASPNSLTGLAAAAELASKLGAELVGVFVEDINLIHMSEAPFANQVGRFSARRRTMRPGQIEREIRAQAEWARQALQKTAERAELRWRFRVVRGSISAELIAATEDTDIIILGQTGWSDRRRLGSTAQAILTQASKLTLILRRDVQLGLAVMVIYDGSEPAKDALRLAGELALFERGKLIVLVIAEDSRARSALRAEVLEWTEPRNIPATFQWITAADPFMVCSIAKTEKSGVLVIPKDGPLLSDEAVLKILNDIDCPVLFVRQPRT